MRDKNNINGLMLVSAYNRINLIKYFKNQLKQQSSNGRTALMYAAEHDNVEMLNYLIKEGNMQDTFGFTALMLCVIRDSRQFAQQLMKHNVDLCKRLKRDYGFYQAGMNALLISALHENMFFIKLLLPFEICQIDVKQIDYVYFLTKNLDIAQMLYGEMQKQKQKSPGQSKNTYNPPTVTAQFRIFLGVFTEIDVDKVKIIHFAEPDQEELIKHQKMEIEDELELKPRKPDALGELTYEQEISKQNNILNTTKSTQNQQNSYQGSNQVLLQEIQCNDSQKNDYDNQNSFFKTSPIPSGVQSINTPSSFDDQREKMRRLMLFRFSNAKNYLGESNDTTVITTENYKLSQNFSNVEKQLSHSTLQHEENLLGSKEKNVQNETSIKSNNNNSPLYNSYDGLNSQDIDLQLQNSIQNSSRLITSNTQTNYIFLKSEEDITKAYQLKNKYEQEKLIEEAKSIVNDLDNIQNELSMSSHLSQIVKTNEYTISQLQNKNQSLQQIINQQIQQLIEKDQTINDLKLSIQNAQSKHNHEKQLIQNQIQQIVDQQTQQQQKRIIHYIILFAAFNVYILLLSYIIQSNSGITSIINQIFQKK